MSKGELVPHRVHVNTTAQGPAPPSFLYPIFELLDILSKHEATDPRDKVYALLGLSTEFVGPLQVKVDYTKNWATLLQGVTTQILGSRVSVHTWDTTEYAVITEYGPPLGTIEKAGAGEIVSFRSPVCHGVRGQESV
jgi:hypothetical protein